MRIPTYESKVQPQIAQAPQPSQAVANTDRQIRQANQQLGQVVSAWGDILQKRAEEKQTQQVIDAETGYRKDMSDLLYNKEKGLMTTRLFGKADGATNDFDAAVEQLRQKYSGMLQTTKQQQAFAQMVDKYTQANRESVAKFELDETNKGKLNTLDASFNQATNEAATNPAMVKTLQDDMANKYTVVLEAMGYDKASIDLQTQKANDGIFLAGCNAYLAKGDYVNARKLFDEGSSRVSAAARNETEKLIQDGEEKQKEAKGVLLAIQAGSAQTPEEFAKALTAIVKNANSRFGLSEEAKQIVKIKNTTDAVIGQTYYLLATSKNPDVDALKFLNKYKNNKDVDQNVLAQKIEEVEEKTIDFTADKLFKSTYKTMTFADGTIDLKRVDASLEKQYSGDDLKKMKDAVHNRINIYNQELDASRVQRYNTALDAIDGVILKKGSYSAALGALNANSAGMDNHEKKRLKDYIDSEYKIGQKASESSALEKALIKSAQCTNYVKAWLAIRNGEMSIFQLDNMRAAGQIDDNQWQGLVKEQKKYSDAADKKSLAFEAQQIHKYIIDKAVEMGYNSQGSEKQRAEYNNFVYYMTQKTSGMSATAAQTFINDQTKESVRKNASWFHDNINVFDVPLPFGWNDKHEGPIWKVNDKQEKERNKNWDKYNKYFGVDNVETIKYNLQAQLNAELNRQRKPSRPLDITDMDQFVKAIGGLTPDAKKVISDLTKKGKPFTAQDVKNGIIALKKQRAKRKSATGTW